MGRKVAAIGIGLSSRSIGWVQQGGKGKWRESLLGLREIAGAGCEVLILSLFLFLLLLLILLSNSKFVILNSDGNLSQ